MHIKELFNRFAHGKQPTIVCFPLPTPLCMSITRQCAGGGAWNRLTIYTTLRSCIMFTFRTETQIFPRFVSGVGYGVGGGG